MKSLNENTNPPANLERMDSRNEIYAIHDQKFTCKELQQYFESKDWYDPVWEAEEFDSAISDVLNKTERYNVQFIQDYENSIEY